MQQKSHGSDRERCERGVVAHGVSLRAVPRYGVKPHAPINPLRGSARRSCRCRR
jgi:hypothetical protein